ncbi:MAG: hypothetical protein GY737_20205 [Desulfobacteraceae bacterium]|nr:hypothetical protein [Desulfobacteraceae bacterium]
MYQIHQRHSIKINPFARHAFEKRLFDFSALKCITTIETPGNLFYKKKIAFYK